MSYSDKETERKLLLLERKLKKLYEEVYVQTHAAAEEYFEKYEERYRREWEKWQAGAYTDTQFSNWVQTQLARGKSWEQLRDSMAKRYTAANITAAEYINGLTPSVFALNANFAAYEVNSAYKNVYFDLVDENVVRDLVMEKNNNIEFRTVKVNPVRDYKWNAQQIQKALVTGIVSGASIDKMADSFMVVQERNRNAAVRNARTACTSAQNAGRITTMQKAKEQGIDVKKRWLSAHDGRVRDSHAHLDGQIRDINKPFDNGLMYPADSAGAPAEVYNCRCTLTYIYPKYDSHVKSNEGYKEWQEAQRAQKKLKETMPELLLNAADDTDLTPKERFETVLMVSKALDKLPLKVKQALGDVTIKYGCKKSMCDVVNKVVYLREGCTEYDVYHEYGHLIENYMISQRQMTAYKRWLVDGITLDDVYPSYNYSSDGKIKCEKPLFFFTSDKLDTEYQSRIYVDNLWEAIGINGIIDVTKMQETVSEPFALYMLGTEIDDKTKRFLERVVL